MQSFLKSSNFESLIIWTHVSYFLARSAPDSGFSGAAIVAAPEPSLVTPSVGFWTVPSSCFFLHPVNATKPSTATSDVVSLLIPVSLERKLLAGERKDQPAPPRRTLSEP